MFTHSTGELRLSRTSKVAPVAVLFLAVFTGYAQVDPSTATNSPRDPGVRTGLVGAGGPLAVNADEGTMFTQGKTAFMEEDDVSLGLGPRFNLNSCAGCHAQPAVGGSSPAVNPQVAVASLSGNVVPSFIRSDGPVREARFQFADPPTNSVRDGGVHALFTIKGGGCNLAQPNFDAALSQNNVIFRIPTPTFGAGLIESITDSAILANKAANGAAKALFGITGRENREGNTGTITRFGWKGQNKSLVIFAGEAYNVEQGVTNELFPQERDETPGCLLNGTPEDHTTAAASADVVAFAAFMRFLAPPAPVASWGNVPATSVANGRTMFTSGLIGCNLCHTPSLQTGTSSSAALSGQAVNLFSDLLLHSMGAGLADGILQGAAGPGEFRTAPLWGLGQRIFFLHDGRTSDLMRAIQAHASNGSEANRSVAAFNALSATRQQDILNFLRSL